MKLKKTSLATLLAAVVLVAGVTTAFATSAKPDDGLANEAVTVTEMSTTLTLVNAEDGTVYLSQDGGKTYEAMTEEEYAVRYRVPEIVWWTYDEYKEWLENEKIALQDLIGERAWTSGRGEFVWTQEIVDETIAMYEGILEDIKNGMLYSKTIDGDADGMLISMNPADVWIGSREVAEGVPAAADFSEYAPFGLVWLENEKALYWNGQRVRYFFDGADMDGKGATAVRFEYADAGLKGSVDVYAVRERVDNGDGSFDPFGPLLRLERYSDAEFDARNFSVPFLVVDSAKATRIEAAFVAPGTAAEAADTGELLEAYVPFGLSYRFHPVTNELSMEWQGKPLHSVYDAEKAVWIANNMRGLDLGPDAVDLEAVYENGRLTGLRETKFDYAEGITYVAEGSAAIEAPGIGFAERFERYAPFGITYEEDESGSGAGNVYYNGQLVSRFADITPEGGAFTFTSAKQGGILVKMLYDRDGNPEGVGIITA